MKDHVYFLRNNITVGHCRQKVLKFREKFARIKFMEFLSHVLVMYDYHNHIIQYFMHGLRQKQTPKNVFAKQFGGFGMYRRYMYIEY